MYIYIYIIITKYIYIYIYTSVRGKFMDINHDQAAAVFPPSSLPDVPERCRSPWPSFCAGEKLGSSMRIWGTYGEPVGNMWGKCGENMGNIWGKYGKMVEHVGERDNMGTYG